ncbi:fimbrial protein (plasmid) [Enterobacteriaceae bacterium Kacie_13]|nr:fimbrial protein [Enterobacteriaceae bacterium Kacie_13]
MFNKAIIAAAMLSALSFNVAQAADGTINFTGKILASTCDINGEASDVKIEVPLGTHLPTEFATTGNKSFNVPFSIDLTECDDSIKNAQVKFTGTADTNPQLIAVTGGAVGVGVGLYEEDGTQIAINTTSATKPVTAKAATLKYSANYVANGEAVEPGDANATADFSIEYP